jgi:peptide-methionine (S)-S-oxide reductase
MGYEQMKMTMVDAGSALPGRSTPMPVVDRHALLGTPIVSPFPDGLERAIFGLGCFWGAERLFWQIPGMYTTAVGYAGGFTPNPTYEEVCSAKTGHAEVVLVVFDPAATSYETVLATFFEGHDPTQHMRQGNDVGTQYRSVILTTSPEQAAIAERVRASYGEAVSRAGYGPVVTEITPAGEFYYAEDYHQQYLAKNPFGYCGLGGTGVRCPTGILGSN